VLGLKAKFFGLSLVTVQPWPWLSDLNTADHVNIPALYT